MHHDREGVVVGVTYLVAPSRSQGGTGICSLLKCYLLLEVLSHAPENKIQCREFS